MLGLIGGALRASRLQARIGAKLPVAWGFALMAAGLWIASTVGVETSYAFLGVVLLVVGVGAGLAYIPATDSVMGSLPKERAGVGSAMNDTTRQVGSALGVAVIGAILASGYRDAIVPALAPALAQLPSDAAAAVRDSLGAAIVLAGQIGGAPGQQLIATGREAFVSGLGGGLVVGALAMVVAGVVTALLLPARERAEDEFRLELSAAGGGRAGAVTASDGSLLRP